MGLQCILLFQNVAGPIRGVAIIEAPDQGDYVVAYDIHEEMDLVLVAIEEGVCVDGLSVFGEVFFDCLFEEVIVLLVWLVLE